MRFMIRSLIGLLLTVITVGLLFMAGRMVADAIRVAEEDEGPRRQTRERVFAVTVEPVANGSVPSETLIYGEVASARVLEVRAATGGVVTELHPEFRNGGRVKKNTLLLRIDPFEARSARDRALTEVAEAEAEVADAAENLDLAEDDLSAATTQQDLREKALARQRTLKSRDATTSSNVETAEINLASAEQAIVAKRKSVVEAKARIARAEIDLSRRQITLAEAERALKDTEFIAPFDGTLSDVNAVLGRRATPNEQLGTLIDSGSLEVVLRLSNSQISRLWDERGELRPAPVTATLEFADTPLSVSGTLDRIDADVGEGQTGRLVYARLDGNQAGILRPGDFVTVRVREPDVADAMLMPATAVASDGGLLLLRGEDRLEEVLVRVVKPIGDNVIVAGAPEGRLFVIERSPQLGPGVKVRAIRPDGKMKAQEFVTLSATEREQMIAAINANTRMPKAAKERVIARLSKDRVAKETVDRLRSRMGSGAADGDTIVLDQSRRDKLIDFVQNNQRMPDDAKRRILAALDRPEVPRDMVERLESRMGG